MEMAGFVASTDLQVGDTVRFFIDKELYEIVEIRTIFYKVANMVEFEFQIKGNKFSNVWVKRDQIERVF